MNVSMINKMDIFTHDRSDYTPAVISSLMPGRWS